MDNTRVFSCRLSVGDCSDVETDESARYLNSRDGIVALRYMAEVLEAYGLEVDIVTSSTGKTAEVTISHPEAHHAERLRKRGGGRPKVSHCFDVTLEWLENHTVEEGMEALHVSSKSTYYRRLRELRERNSLTSR